MPQMRLSEGARDRLHALAASVKRSPGDVIEILSHAQVGTLVDLLADAAARGEPMTTRYGGDAATRTTTRTDAPSVGGAGTRPDLATVRGAGRADSHV